MDKLVSLCKRRGFVFQSSEIYGGLNGAWDYGPLGVELLKNIKDAWWNEMTRRSNVEGIDASILMHPRVWEASGHVENFTDPMVDCKQCKSRYRLDVLFDEISLKKKKEALRELHPGKFEGQQKDEVIVEEFNKLGESSPSSLLSALSCPNCGNKGTFTEARKFNLMFKTFVGPVEDSSAVVYLRPETAQGIFVNFLNVQSSSRQKIPFGVAQIGKAFRNEINTKNFLFRTREFEQMEMQFFVKPGTDDTWFEYWREQRLHWFISLGMPKEKLQWHRHEPGKLAHYAKDAYDIEFKFPFGWGEIEGIHNRTDFDLSRHEQFSGKSLKYFDDETKEKYTPFIVETSAGASRSFMAFLVNAYAEEDAPTAEGQMETRVVMKFHPKLAPMKAAIFPLVNRDGMPELARKIEEDLRPHMKVFYDDSGAVGRRYRRQDEIGTPFCITIDSQTLQDQTVTIRDRDSMQQERIASAKIVEYIQDKLTKL
ncbi:MAG: glycine--tRNA ligase [Ignavibacteriae bacterium]|nr:glycine--tRNA ligase [Ignavibacteria bacterium]MBI3363408.1 glycine--tRNA ligase [Ignavibacteriota bacterium]